MEKLKVMEKEMLGMAREVEKLRAEVLNADRSTRGNHSCLLELLYVFILSRCQHYIYYFFIYTVILVTFVAQNPHNGSFMDQDRLYPTPPVHGSSGYVDSYARSTQMGVGASGDGASPYGVGNATPTSNTGGGATTDSGGVGAHDASHAWR